MLRVSLCTLVLGLALSLGALAQGKWTVTPGVGVGPVKVGMTVAAVEKLVSRDAKADHQVVNGKPQWIFYGQGVQVHYDNAGRALQVVADKPGLATPEGVQLGDSLTKVEAAYGRGYMAHQLPTAAGLPKQYTYVYKNLGLEFQTEGDRVILIYVFAPLR